MFIPGGSAIPTTDYTLTNSLRFRASASAFLNRTPASAGNRRTWTWSAWVKIGSPSNFYALFGSTNNCFIGYGQSTGGANLGIADGNTSTMNVQTAALFRDPSAWYHFVVALDTPQATASNRVKIYVNGVQQTALAATTYPAQNAEFNINNSTAQNIGRTWDGFQYFDGYMDEINFIDGQALTPSSFGSTNATTGVWQPARYTGTYGTNGFYLNFTNIALTSGSNTGLGQDFSGNGNFWNTNNISVTAGTTYDAMLDVPTLTSATTGNYCTLNSAIRILSGSVTEGNLRGAGSNFECWGTIAFPSTGKYYFEYTQNGSTGAGNGPAIGIVGLNPPDVDYGVKYNRNGTKWVNGTNSIAYGASYTTGDVIGVAYDADNNSIVFYKNNVSQGATTTTSGYTYLPYQFDNSGNGGFLNFGQRPFAYTPPTGFNRLNTFNLSNSTIVKGNTVMDATLYTGNSTSNRTITNASGFKPDLIWIKNRGQAIDNILEDSVRTAGSNKILISNSTAAEGDAAGNGYINSINSNGFSVTAGTSGVNQYLNVNENSIAYVAWQWQAGQGSTSSNTAGSITSTVSVNTTAGFSIVTYTGNATNNATIGHGLGVAPKMVITKNRATTTFWYVYHSSLPATNNLYLNTTDSQQADNVIRSTNATTFTVSSSSAANGTSMVAYCWAEIAGFSRFGSYTGNGSADGPFVFTGFMPKYLMIKSSSIAGEWAIYDVPRDLYNPMGLGGGRLRANTAGAETGADSAQYIDFLSNGFKIRNTSGFDNQSGATYIYMAFASNPFKNSNAF